MIQQATFVILSATLVILSEAKNLSSPMKYDDLTRLARDNSVRDPENVINSVLKGTRNFEELAEKNGVDSFHIELIAKRLRELSPEGARVQKGGATNHPSNFWA